MSVATIGSALAEKRSELDLEKGQAADKIGMSRTTYSSYEQDAQRPSIDVFPALAKFLEIPMEELLTLYGATCVAAVRPSLERLLSGQEAENGEVISTGQLLSDFDAFAPIEPETSVELSDVGTEKSDGASNEVLLELQEVANRPDSQDRETSGLSKAEDLRESGEVSESYEPRKKENSWLEPPAPAEDSVVSDAVVVDPTPHFVMTSVSESQGKDSEIKRKKKKRKKKK